MKRSTLLLLGLFLMLCGQINAQTVSVSDAKAKAVAFLSSGAQKLPAKKGIKRQTPAVQNVELAYTSEKDGKTCFYVFNNGTDGGFVIVGGDKEAKDILGYVPQGHFDYEKAPENFKWWLGKYEQEIDTAIIINSTLPVSVPKRTAANSSLTDIPDMITTKWNQGEPYNTAIPTIVDGENTYHSPTGCVPTALAQIMNYWKYPTHGIGSKSYSTTYTDLNQTVTYSADFENTTYDWNNMRDTYEEGQYTEQESQSVSTLMYHIGVALEVSYGMYGTGYNPIESADNIQGTTGLMRDLPKYFGYDEGMEDVKREDFTLDQWTTLLYNELSLGRPVYYTGVDSIGGHAFVCHGYSSSMDMFSFNWGWGGYEDGYFAISGTYAVNGYSKMQEQMLIGIRPAGYNNGSSDLCFGDKFLVDGILYKVYDEKNKQVEVTHTKIENVWGNSNLGDDYSNYLSGDVTIPSVVQHNGTDYTVSRIGAYAFLTGNNGQTNVTSISLPATITSLGESAFYYCQSLTDSILIPDAVELIPQRCFEQCNRSPYISIPSSVKIIGANAFFGCRLLDQISLPEGCYKISYGAFQGCTNLSIVNIPSTMRIFGLWCFNETNLTRMTFPCESFVPADHYTDGDYTWWPSATPFPSSIEKGTLYVPSELVEIYRNTTDNYWSKWGNVESIDNINPNIGKRFVDGDFEYMIYNDSCVSLSNVVNVDYSKKSMIVPSTVSYDGHAYNVESISSGAFEYQGFGVKGIDKLVLSEGIKEIRETAFQGCGFKYIELPNSLEKIGNCAFNICNELESLDIPANVKVAQGLLQCESLKQVILHEGIECVGPNFLAKCPKLKDVYFPASLWYSGGGTLTDCESLRSIVSLTDSLSIAPYKFEWNEDFYKNYGDVAGTFGLGYGTNQESVKLYIPEKLLQDENSDYNKYIPWNDFPNKLPYVAMESFQLDNTIDIMVNEQRMISQKFFPENASYKQLKWSSSNEDVATVNCEGYVYAISEGETTITASSIDGSDKVQSCIVRVHPTSMPSDAASYWLYQPEYNYVSNREIPKDTVSFIVNSEGGELYLAVDIARTTRTNNLFFSMANQTFDVIPSGNKTVIMHFNNVQDKDTLQMLWKDRYIDGVTGDLVVSNICVWNEYSYPIGDVNLDEKVNITDAVDIINDRLGYESTNFIRKVSDVNKDEQYTVADAIAVVNIMYGEPANSKEVHRNVQADNESLLLYQSDDNTLAIDMNSVNGYSAFQFDVKLPNGVELNEVSLNENRGKDFAVQYHKVDNNIYKVAVYNLENEPLTTGNGNLLTFNVSGTKESDVVSVTNIHFSTVKAVDVMFDDMTLATTTGINSISATNSDEEYNVAGLRVNKNYKGIVIVNGKKIVKQ